MLPLHWNTRNADILAAVRAAGPEKAGGVGGNSGGIFAAENKQKSAIIPSL